MIPLEASARTSGSRKNAHISCVGAMWKTRGQPLQNSPRILFFDNGLCKRKINENNDLFMVKINPPVLPYPQVVWITFCAKSGELERFLVLFPILRRLCGKLIRSRYEHSILHGNKTFLPHVLFQIHPARNKTSSADFYARIYADLDPQTHAFSKNSPKLRAACRDFSLRPRPRRSRFHRGENCPSCILRRRRHWNRRRCRRCRPWVHTPSPKILPLISVPYPITEPRPTEDPRTSAFVPMIVLSPIVAGPTMVA